MANRFGGFSPEALQFLRDLKENNDREWFTPRKQVYEETLRQPMIELVRAIHGEMISFAPQYVGEPAKCVFRIYRDTRFSKDKTPYKTHVAASFSGNGLSKTGSGYYVGISAEGIEIGGGMYAPEPEVLLAIRQAIADDPEGFRETYSAAKTRKLVGEPGGESVSRPPKGFDPAHPAIDLLKRKQHFFMVHLDAEVATTPKLLNEVTKRFAVMTPLIEFLDRPLVKTLHQRF
jgi:uncharacterized protein (TIGR02453 family)